MGAPGRKDLNYKRTPSGHEAHRMARAARAAAFHAIPLIERIERFISPEPMSGCWLWTAALNTAGYAVYTDVQGQPQLRVNRWLWAQKNGPIPSGMFMCHKCDVPSCVNPDHMFIGDVRDNTRDCFKKGRHSSAKLKPDQVRTIRLSPDTKHALAEQYGVTYATIHEVKTGRTWGYLP